MLYLTVDEQLVATFELGDELRESSKALVAYCKQQGLETTMLTGDISNKSEEVASFTGIEHVVKGVSPEQKLAHIQALTTDRASNDDR